MSAIILGTNNGYIVHSDRSNERGEPIAFASVNYKTYPLDLEDCIELCSDLNRIIKEYYDRINIKKAKKEAVKELADEIKNNLSDAVGGKSLDSCSSLIDTILMYKMEELDNER